MFMFFEAVITILCSVCVVVSIGLEVCNVHQQRGIDFSTLILFSQSLEYRRAVLGISTKT